MSLGEKTHLLSKWLQKGNLSLSLLLSHLRRSLLSTGRSTSDLRYLGDSPQGANGWVAQDEPTPTLGKRKDQLKTRLGPDWVRAKGVEFTRSKS